MKKAIFIAAFNRPQYLYVTLDSLRRCRGVENWDVFIDFDGGSDADFRVCSDLFEHFAVHRRRNLGCMDHPTAILKTALGLGYDGFVYAEDDQLFRTDLLEYFDHAIPSHSTGLLSSFYRPDGVLSENNWQSASPCFIPRSESLSIIEFMESKRWEGLPNCCDDWKPITTECKYHDICWFAWVKSNNVITHYARIQHSLNFGLVGMNYPYFEQHNKLFKGPSNGWLSEVVSYFASPEMAWWPRSPGFQYQ